jgi:hypothetical protein
MSESKKRLTDKTFSKKASEVSSIISEMLGLQTDNLGTINDAGVKKLEKVADDASTQNKRARHAATQLKKLFHSKTSLTKITHAVLRQGLDAIKSIRREESKTVKHLAKTKSAVRLIDEKTSKAIELTEYATGKEIAAIGEQTTEAKSIIDARYSSLSQFTRANTQDQRAEIQSRGQRRIEQAKKPWRN